MRISIQSKNKLVKFEDEAHRKIIMIAVSLKILTSRVVRGAKPPESIVITNDNGTYFVCPYLTSVCHNKHVCFTIVGFRQVWNG